MFRRKLWLFVLVLLILAPVGVVYASKPIEFDGTWGDTYVDLIAGTVSFTFDSPDFYGTSTQSLAHPGRAAKGIFIGTVGGTDVECEYNLAAFTLPNAAIANKENQVVSHFSMGKCADGIALHTVGTALLVDPVSYTGTFEGSYHFVP